MPQLVSYFKTRAFTVGSNESRGECERILSTSLFSSTYNPITFNLYVYSFKVLLLESNYSDVLLIRPSSCPDKQWSSSK